MTVAWTPTSGNCGFGNEGPDCNLDYDIGNGGVDYDSDNQSGL